jgi:glycosyltransferase involved in cell wall biosynthesis
MSLVGTAASFPPAGDIVIFQPEFEEFGGEERVILSLSEGLHAQGKPHSVLCYHDHIGLAKHARLPLKVHALKPADGGWAKAMALREALALLQRRRDPVPVLFSIQAALHAGFASLSARLPYFLRIPDTYSLLRFSPHDDHEGQPPGPAASASDLLSVRHWATRLGVQRARGFATNTRALSAEMHALYGRQAEVIYLGGFGQQPLAQAPARPAVPIELLSVSRLQPNKRVDWMLRGAAEILRSPAGEPPFRLHVVGTGPEQAALHALCRELGLDGVVQFHGFVSDAALADLYRRSHAFLMPALQGYGLPAIEALYRMQGVVLNRESGVVELLGDTPWVVVTEGGPTGFTRGMREMLQRARDPHFFAQPLPALPTEQAWARQVIATFGW